jgi:hypothetical protein
MTTRVKHEITEVDVVAFTEAIDKVEGTGTWPAGTVGAVVSDYGTMKEVEISDDRGVPLDSPVVPVKKLKLVSKHSDRIAAANLSISATRQKKRRKPQRATAARSSVA